MKVIQGNIGAAAEIEQWVLAGGRVVLIGVRDYNLLDILPKVSSIHVVSPISVGVGTMDMEPINFHVIQGMSASLYALVDSNFHRWLRGTAPRKTLGVVGQEDSLDELTALAVIDQWSGGRVPSFSAGFISRVWEIQSLGSRTLNEVASDGGVTLEKRMMTVAGYLVDGELPEEY